MSGTERVPAIRCVALSFSYGELRAVDGISLEVEAGEIFGLLGPNGAGKTTTIRMLTTLVAPRSGDAFIFGMNTRTNSMRIRREIGYMPQQLSIDPQLTGVENVSLFARLFDVARKARRRVVDEAMGSVGLSEVGGKYPISAMPGWLRGIVLVNPLSYEVNALRALLLGTSGSLGLDMGVLLVAAGAGVVAASSLLRRLVR